MKGLAYEFLASPGSGILWYRQTKRFTAEGTVYSPVIIPQSRHSTCIAEFQHITCAGDSVSDVSYVACTRKTSVVVGASCVVVTSSIICCTLVDICVKNKKNLNLLQVDNNAIADEYYISSTGIGAKNRIIWRSLEVMVQ